MAERRIMGHAGYRVNGTVGVPGDKSVAHRVLLLGALARGTTYVKGVPENSDIEATLRCLTALGIVCERAGDAVSVQGLGRGRFRVPDLPLDCGGSAATMRMLLGAIAGRGRRALLTGNASLQARPMDRVIEPLSRMGARFEAREGNRFPPVAIVSPEAVEPVDYTLEVASAQVKSAIILAALAVRKGRTVIRGAISSRDHTERLVPRMGGCVVATKDAIIVERSELEAIATAVPGDTSSAAFFAAAAAILKGSKVTIANVCINPTRMGFFEALSWMGGDVTIEELPGKEPEPVGNVTVKWAQLKGIEIHEEAVPFLVDEVPLVLLLGAFASGETVVRGIEELRVKESDRVKVACEGLRALGAEIECGPDWVRVHGGKKLKGCPLDPAGDHRMAMMFTVAAYGASGDSVIRNAECAGKSFPQFYGALERVVQH